MHTLPPLDYPYDALEPYIDRETMLVHHSKHHKTYTDNLNNALADHPELQSKDIETLLKKPDDIPEEIRMKIINNGGGYYNHDLYWKIMTPKKSAPQGALSEALNITFGSPDIFKEKFSNAALNHFGSGWGWLVVNSGKLDIISTPNQNSPISENKISVLGIDVWEHAYYLKYQNRRADYINAWWNVVNWDYVSSLFLKNK